MNIKGLTSDYNDLSDKPVSVRSKEKIKSEENDTVNIADEHFNINIRDDNRKFGETLCANAKRVEISFNEDYHLVNHSKDDNKKLEPVTSSSITNKQDKPPKVNHVMRNIRQNRASKIVPKKRVSTTKDLDKQINKEIKKTVTSSILDKIVTNNQTVGKKVENNNKSSNRDTIQTNCSTNTTNDKKKVRRGKSQTEIINWTSDDGGIFYDNKAINRFYHNPKDLDNDFIFKKKNEIDFKFVKEYDISLKSCSRSFVDGDDKTHTNSNYTSLHKKPLL